jgi:uncharacterized RDD family membrane protein YckC
MENDQQEMKQECPPAPFAKRMIAFGMDAVLLFILIQAIALVIPKLYDDNSKREFNQLVHQVSLLGSDDRFDSTKMATFIEDSKLSIETYEMIMNMLIAACGLPILYFCLGEIFFNGKTLGKATFGIRTEHIDGSENVTLLKAFIRSTLKGLALITLITPFLLPGLLNFCFCLFNGKRRCIHDILSGTITVQPKS